MDTFLVLWVSVYGRVHHSFHFELQDLLKYYYSLDTYSWQLHHCKHLCESHGRWLSGPSHKPLLHSCHSCTHCLTHRKHTLSRIQQRTCRWTAECHHCLHSTTLDPEKFYKTIAVNDKNKENYCHFNNQVVENKGWVFLLNWAWHEFKVVLINS